MIKYYYRSLRRQTIQELDDYRRGTWVYAEAPSEEELAQLAQKFDLEPGNLQDALDEDEMPRLEKEGDQVYIFVRFAFKNREGELITKPLLFVLASEAVITIAPVPLPSLDRFLRGKVDFATTQRAKLVLQILHQIVDQYDSYINDTSPQIKAIRARLR